MAFEITKGDITIRTDSEREAERAFRWLNTTGTPPSDPPPAAMAQSVDVPEIPVLQPAPPLAEVRELTRPEPQLISVHKPYMDVLDVVFLFSDGVTAKSIQELSELPLNRITKSLTNLKKLGLVERIEGSHKWHVTPLARRAKLVAG